MKRKNRKRKVVVPSYAVLPLLSCFVLNAIVYFGTEYIAAGWKHYDLTLPVDRAVPVIPSSIVIYLGCYIFWIINYILIARQGEEHCLRFATADMISRLICGFFYLILPTTNVRPELTGSGVWVTLLMGIYEIDSPTRLFPSIHCLISWFCYIGIRGQKKVPKAYQIFSCLFALLVCVSTQLTKQHYIVDVFGGILIAEVTYGISFHTQIYKYPKRVFDWLHMKIFSRINEPCGKGSEV